MVSAPRARLLDVKNAKRDCDKQTEKIGLSASMLPWRIITIRFGDDLELSRGYLLLQIVA